MSSLSKYRGGYRIQVDCIDGQRRQLYLSKKTTKAAANTFQSHVDHMIQQQRLQAAYDMKVLKWVNGLDDKHRKKLATLRLITNDLDSRDIKQTLKGWCDFFITSEQGHSPNVIRKLTNTANNLFRFFGEDKIINTITRGDAKRFIVFMCKAKSEGGRGMNPKTTVPRQVELCRQIFNGAISDNIVGTNVFRQQTLCATVGRGKAEIISREDRQKVFSCLPNAEWKLRHVLKAHNGLRCPSELNELKWSGINWEEQSMIVDSPKTEHNEGGEWRKTGIMPEVLPLLREAFDAAPDGAVYVLPRTTNKTMRKWYQRFMKFAGVRWPAIFMSLRKSAVNDAHLVYPAHVVHEWFGHSSDVSKKHYTEANEAHYAMLRGLTENAGHGSDSIFRETEMYSNCTHKRTQHSQEDSGNTEQRNTAESRESGTIQHDVVPSGIVEKRGMGDTGLEPVG